MEGTFREIFWRRLSFEWFWRSDDQVRTDGPSPTAKLLMQISMNVLDIRIGQIRIASLGRHGDRSARRLEAVLNMLGEHLVTL